MKTRASKNMIIFIVLFMMIGCASIFTDYDEKLLENKEFNESVKVVEIPQPTEPVENSTTQASQGAETPSVTKPVTTKTIESSKSVKNVKAALKKEDAKELTQEVKSVSAKKHEPALEDSEGFVGRRPAVDPFVENEELVYAVSYFAVEAGRFTMRTHPFVQVNGKKSYHISLHAVSSSVFSLFYAVDDLAEAFLDYENLVPYSYSIKARESKQIRDVKSYFNWATFKGKTWDKKIKKGQQPTEKNYEWDILPYSQNVFTVGYYMRCFQYAVGKELAVRVAHEGENIIMKAKVLREEKLRTSAGTFDTFVLKPEFEIDGVFKPVGDVFMWITKDQFHRIARIESKIKIGKLVVSLENIKP